VFGHIKKVFGDVLGVIAFQCTHTFRIIPMHGILVKGAILGKFVDFVAHHYVRVVCGDGLMVIIIQLHTKECKFAKSICTRLEVFGKVCDLR
jgi:hypothetical protein